MYFLYILGNILASIFPRNLCYAIAKFFALMQFYLSPKDRKAVTYNLLPVIENKKEIKRYVKKVFINFSYYLVDFFRYPKLNENFVKKYVKVSGLKNLQQFVNEGKGIIALTIHLGNYELAGAVASLLGYPVSAVALPHRDRRINTFFDRRRHMFGMEVIPTGIAVRGCFSALRYGRILALLGDKDFAGGGVKVTMFSNSAYLPRGVAFFALKTQAPIVPAFLVRENKYFYHLIFEKPILLNREVDQDEVGVIHKYIPVLEKYITQYPDQWYMFEKYWQGERDE